MKGNRGVTLAVLLLLLATLWFVTLSVAGCGESSSTTTEAPEGGSDDTGAGGATGEPLVI